MKVGELIEHYKMGVKPREWKVTYTVFNAEGEPVGTQVKMVNTTTKENAAAFIRKNVSNAIVSIE